MKIRASLQPEAMRRLEQSGKASKSKRRSSDEAAKGDTVDISSQFDELRQLSDAARDVSDVRMEKVAPLKEKIAKGEYHVSAEDIADSIVEHVMQRRVRNDRT